ncbi:MAG: hypothetical protein K6T65_12925 [Peptococcaceae bacterium]|nr:hypothetical protein [Peptococcaceae bacterium]
MLKEFFTEEKVQELCEDIIAAGNRWHGIQKFSGRHGLKPSGVNAYFYRHILTPELENKLPKAQSNPLQKTAANFTSNPSEIKKVRKPHNPGLLSERILMRELKKAFLRSNGSFLTKEDIDAAAKAAGVHYATALAVWGNAVKKDENLYCKRSDCPWADKDKPVCSIRHNCPWHLGKIFSGLINTDEDLAELVAATGIDDAEIKNMVGAYRAFGNDWDPSLTYLHHVYASRTDDPRGWLEKAKKNRWTEFRLKEVIDQWSMKKADKARKENLGKVVKVLEKENRGLRKDNEQLKVENESLKAAVNALEEENRRLKEAVSEKDKEVDSLKAANGELEANLRRQEKLSNLISLDHLKEIQEKNGLLIKKLAAARKVNLYLMMRIKAASKRRGAAISKQPEISSRMEMAVN